MNYCFYICIIKFIVILSHFLVMDIVERLISFRNHIGLTNSQFADRAGIPRPTLSQFLNGRNKRLSDDFTAKLHDAYPDLNILWLLFGEGNMTIDSDMPAISDEIGRNSSHMPDQDPKNEAHAEQQLAQNSTNRSDQSTKSGVNETFFDRNESGGLFNSDIAQQFPLAGAPVPHPVIPTDPAKRIQSIMVFYSDNSYEIFTPAPADKS